MATDDSQGRSTSTWSIPPRLICVLGIQNIMCACVCRSLHSPRKVFLVQRDDDGLDGVAHRLQERLDGGAHESLKTLKKFLKNRPVLGQPKHDEINPN